MGAEEDPTDTLNAFPDANPKWLEGAGNRSESVWPSSERLAIAAPISLS
jgi:hypothetical protein